MTNGLSDTPMRTPEIYIDMMRVPCKVRFARRTAWRAPQLSVKSMSRWRQPLHDVTRAVDDDIRFVRRRKIRLGLQGKREGPSDAHGAHAQLARAEKVFRWIV